MTAAGRWETDNDAVIDASEHPMVVAALARMGGSGGWARILSGRVLHDPLDQADADLLVTAGVLGRRGGRFAVLRKEAVLSDPEAMSRTMIASLQQALQHARGGVAGWTGEDLDLVRNQGFRSAMSGDVIADGLLPHLPFVAAAFAGGEGRFLDVGTGTGAVSVRLCERFAGLTCVGLDVLPHVLDMARCEIAASGMSGRIEVRNQSVSQLDEVGAYDLAWVPQAFIPRDELVPGLARVHRALRPGGAVVVPTLVSPDLAAPMSRAVITHAGHVLGGGPIELGEAHRLLEDAGFTEVLDHDYGGQVVLTAVRG